MKYSVYIAAPGDFEMEAMFVIAENIDTFEKARKIKRAYLAKKTGEVVNVFLDKRHWNNGTGEVEPLYESVEDWDDD